MGTPKPANARPNIVIFHCHDLGQYLHCYGAETVQSPHVDAFAAKGVLFTRSYCTAPQCSPSRASLFTGRYPHNNGMMGLAHSPFGWDLHPGEKHLGQLLKQAGYVTAGAGTIHETHAGTERCGLDHYEGGFYAHEIVDNAIGQLRFLKDAPGPFYLQVGLMEPHRLPNRARPNADMGFTCEHFGPDSTLGVQVPGYLSDTPGTREELAELQGSVRHMDHHFGRFLDAIRALGLEDNTLVIFTADHGVAMPRAKCNLYDPGIQVPFILRLPSRPGWHGGKTYNEMISNLDYVPTLLELIGEPVGSDIQGQSLTPLLDGADYQAREALFAEITYHDYYDPRRCIRTEGHKLIVNFATAPCFMDPSQSWRPRSDISLPQNHSLYYHPDVELYDLNADPWELSNLADAPAHAQVRDNLLRQLREHLVMTEDPILQGAVTSPAHERALVLFGV